MRFFAYIAMAFSANATNTFTQAEKEELFEVWTAQAESGEISPEVYGMLAQALDGDAPEDFYAECDALAQETVIPDEFMQVDADIDADNKKKKKSRGRRGRKYA